LSQSQGKEEVEFGKWQKSLAREEIFATAHPVYPVCESFLGDGAQFVGARARFGELKEAFLVLGGSQNDDTYRRCLLAEQVDDEARVSARELSAEDRDVGLLQLYQFGDLR